MRHVNGLPYIRQKHLARRVTGNNSGITIAANAAYNMSAAETTIGLRLWPRAVSGTDFLFRLGLDTTLVGLRLLASGAGIETEIQAAVNDRNHTFDIETGKWLELIMRFDQTAGSELFVNGSLITTTSADDSAGDPSAANLQDIVLGQDLDADVIDFREAVMFDGALTDAEVFRLSGLPSWYNHPDAVFQYDAAENLETKLGVAPSGSTGATLVYTDKLQF